MLPSQRELFNIPREVCYFNAAGWSPIPKAVQEAGRAGAMRKGQPWKLEEDFFKGQCDRVRRAAAALIGADSEDVAIIPSVGYGVSTAAKILTIPRGSRVLVLEDDHSSPSLEWLTRAPQQGFTVETVKRPGDGDWTAAVLDAIERKGAPPLALVSISSIHWSCGSVIDLDLIAPALRKLGGKLLVDATHGVGVMATDVRRLDPDFLIFPTYKWVLGPYGRAFLYIAKRNQEGEPLEQTGFGRRAVSAELSPYLSDISYVAGARRFDMGERDYFVSLEMASVGMEMVAHWGAAAITERLAMLTERLADGLRNSGVRVPERRLRAPHILSLEFPKGMPKQLPERLAAEGVHAAPRVGRLRISPHVYNDEADVERFVEVFRKVAL